MDGLLFEIYAIDLSLKKGIEKTYWTYLYKVILTILVAGRVAGDLSLLKCVQLIHLHSIGNNYIPGTRIIDSKFK